MVRSDWWLKQHEQQMRSDYSIGILSTSQPWANAWISPFRSERTQRENDDRDARRCELFSSPMSSLQRSVCTHRFRSFESLPSVSREDSRSIELFHSLGLCLAGVVQSNDHMAYVQVTVGEGMSKEREGIEMNEDEVFLLIVVVVIE